MSSDNKSDSPVPRIHGADRRGQAYTKIADVHKQVLQAKWVARTKGGKLALHPDILVHLEDATAFLAEEMLACRSMLEAHLKLEAQVDVDPADEARERARCADVEAT